MAEEVNKQKNNNVDNSDKVSELIIKLKSQSSDLNIDTAGEFTIKAGEGENIDISLPAYMFDSIAHCRPFPEQ